MNENYQTNSTNKELPNKIPPQDTDAEISLLGSLMLDKNAIIKVVDFLETRDFYKEVHREIYKTIIDIFEKREPIDLISLASHLREKNKLEKIGGNSYLTELINSVPTAVHVFNYAKIVQKKRILRDLISASYDIGILGFDESEDTSVLLDKAERKIFSIAQGSLSQNFIPIKTTLEETFQRIDRLSKSQDELRGVPTGFTELDHKLSGLQKADLVILAARPSMGKSALAFDIARNTAILHNIPVGIFSLEMSKDQIVDRMLASMSYIDLWKLRTGRLEDDDFTNIQQAMDRLSKAPIYIDDASTSNILQMRAMARRLQADKGLELLIVDYLQLMEPRNTNVSMVQQMTEISRALKGLARELNIPVLALSQLSRAVEQRTPPIPRLSDLRESGAIEQDADVVMFIHRPDKYKESAPKNIAEILIAKHRNGPTGKIELSFDEQRASFRNIEKNMEMEAPEESMF